MDMFTSYGNINKPKENYRFFNDFFMLQLQPRFKQQQVKTPQLLKVPQWKTFLRQFQQLWKRQQKPQPRIKQQQVKTPQLIVGMVVRNKTSRISSLYLV